MESKFRIFATVNAVLLFCLLLSGCAGSSGSETVVIPDTGEEQTAVQAGQPFQVGTIYPVTLSSGERGELLGWSDAASLLGMFADAAGQDAEKLLRAASPYEKFAQQGSLHGDIGTTRLSPDGRYIASLLWGGNKVSIHVYSLSDGREQELVSLPGRTMGSKEIAWSNNGRYLSYCYYDAAKGTFNIGVYDAETKTLAGYPTEKGSIQDTVSSAKLTDDGTAALIVKNEAISSGLLVETKGAGAFSVQSEHAANSGQADWIDNDRLAFIGTDNTLYAYDLRTAETAVLLEQAGSFVLSPDQKVIAYTYSGKDEIFAGKLQGNNVLYGKSVYKGIVPLQMAWSPDNGKLLVDGRKSYLSAPTQAAPAPEDIRPFIIEFQP